MSAAAFAGLERVYAEMAAEIASLSPVCRQSSRCCRFVKSGHELFTTPLEYEYLRERTGFAGAEAGQAREGTCPFLKHGLCGVRDDRMLGCRVYFCDPAYQGAMGGLYEKYHARVTAVMREHGIPYGYFRFLDRIRGDLENGRGGGPPGSVSLKGGSLHDPER